MVMFVTCICWGLFVPCLCRYGQFDKAKETFDMVKDYEAIYDLAIAPMNPSALRNLTEELQNRGANPELSRHCDQVSATEGPFKFLLLSPSNPRPLIPQEFPKWTPEQRSRPLALPTLRPGQCYPHATQTRALAS